MQNNSSVKENLPQATNQPTQTKPQNESPQPEMQPEKESKGLKIALIFFGTLILAGVLGAGAFLIYNNSQQQKENGAADEKKVTEQKDTKDTVDTEDLEEEMIFQQETASMPSWIKETPNYEDGPWHDGLNIAVSEDGLTFTNDKLFLEHSGVANLILTSDDKLIATFQYFSFVNEDMFDLMAYATSSDFGKTWSNVKPITITDFETKSTACDPTLVELEDGQFRLYFTYHQMGEEYPQFFSAIGETMDSSFLSEGLQLQTEEIILDPAVVKFKNVWHHYTVKHGTEFEEEPSENPTSIHSISEDGLAFKLVDDIQIDMQMLGDVIEDDGGLRFYSGSKSAFSKDGYNWTMDEGERVKGADPGVVKLPDGTYIALYTSVSKGY